MRRQCVSTAGAMEEEEEEEEDGAAIQDKIG